MANLTPENLPQALEIAALPDQIRGYEKIKEQNIAKVKQQAVEKLAALKAAEAGLLVSNVRRIPRVHAFSLSLRSQECEPDAECVRT